MVVAFVVAGAARARAERCRLRTSQPAANCRSFSGHICPIPGSMPPWLAAVDACSRCRIGPRRRGGRARRGRADRLRPDAGPPGPGSSLRPANGVFDAQRARLGSRSRHVAVGRGGRGHARQVSADEILATYYPGTTKTLLPNTPIRVLLAGDDTTDEQVLPASGLTVSRRAQPQTACSRPARVAGGSLGRRPPGCTCSGWTATWTTVPVAGRHDPRPRRCGFTSATGLVSVVYPGRLLARLPRHARRPSAGAPAACTAPSSCRWRATCAASCRRRCPPSWKPAALQAQAVAARTYAAQRRSSARARAPPTTSATRRPARSSPAPPGPRAAGQRTGYEYAATDAAITATAGHIRTYAGGRRSPSSPRPTAAGRSAAASPTCRPGPTPGTAPIANSVHSWSATLPVSALEARYPRSARCSGCGSPRGTATASGAAGCAPSCSRASDGAGRPTSVTTTGAGIAAARSWPAYSDGLRSNWWTITNGGHGRALTRRRCTSADSDSSATLGACGSRSSSSSCSRPVPGGTGRYSRELAAAAGAVAAGGPARRPGWTAWHRDLAAARVAGVAGPRRLPLPRRLLAEPGGTGAGPAPSGDVVHAPTPLLPPARRGTAAGRHAARRRAVDPSRRR